MKNHRKSRRLSLESLEGRTLLSGTITLDTSDGNLVILGDANPNNISVRQTGLGEFTVTGNNGELFRTPGGLFQKNAVNVTNVRGGLLVSLASGNDSVTIQGLSDTRPIGAFVTVLTGSGKDHVDINTLQTGGVQYPPQIKIPAELNRQRGAIGEAAYWNATIPGAITIDTGAGDRTADADTVTIRSASVLGPTLIDTGAGDDQVTLDGLTGWQAIINTDRGADHVNIAHQTQVSLYSLTMTLGDQNDWVEIGPGQLDLISSITPSAFYGGSGTNTLAGIQNLTPGSNANLVDPATTGFVVLKSKARK